MTLKCVLPGHINYSHRDTGCRNEAVYYVWYKSCGGLYTYHCIPHLMDALAYNAQEPVSQITLIEAGKPGPLGRALATYEKLEMPVD